MTLTKKVLTALFLVVFSVGAFACGGSKDKDEEKRFEIKTTVI